MGTGGAIYTQSSVTVTNSTFSSNSSALGGAVFTVDGGITELIASTVTANTSTGDTTTDSGSLDNDQGGQIILRQTIVANQTEGADCFGTMTSDDYNLDSDSTCNLTGVNDHPGEDPDLGPLADNGGPTPTHLPNAGSPVIDSAGLNCPEVDQRGRPTVRRSLRHRQRRGPGGDLCPLRIAVHWAGCEPAERAVQCLPDRVDAPSEEPVTYCINPWTGALSYAASGVCSPATQTHIMPDDGDLLVCVSKYTGEPGGA